jgi:3-oxoacid CoA-transferase subunit A
MMSILFSGDFHANSNNELSTITKKTLLKQFGSKAYTAIKYHVILGDGGFLWLKNQKTDAYNCKVLAYRPFPVLCVIGNHDPILGRTDMVEVDLGLGETVWQAAPQVFYLKRGKIYVIDGFKFLALGGALSIDMMFRIPGISWWANEYWSKQEQETVFALLEQENSFDFVLSHTGPHRVNAAAFSHIMSLSEKYNDQVAFLNDQIDDRISCKQWWCGHWHMDRYCYDEERKRGYQYLYRTVKILTRKQDDYAILPQ